ncbi:COP9 signalosome complex subunit 6 [Aspergillus mulundensis]|uniref:COP9 signalosome complex subunit 6 n=1 Tax=Aspergillus mulundensis TaxID=1810919 RepID=A0A3D8RXZ2_9EURO|nr:COP9 signalosome complex subunit 6 [Aspergillus mulundensis]RDW78730.1 COP9 signalosome complex subunit 6 [Aspergillus mulundensis]
MSDQAESILSQKSSDSGLHIQLHPLVLLTISDHITRHAARSQHGPIIGALLGQQNGRQITLEHGFECVVEIGPNGEAQLPNEWFVERVKQFKDVHKLPALDLIGWWSTAPPSGPTTAHLPIHRQILQNHNESAVFLAFHPSQVQEASSGQGKLPLTIYESVYEGESVTESGKAMQVDGEEQSLSIRFRELPYTVETGEAEMIGIDTVARTARNAAAIETSITAASSSQTESKKQKEKQSTATELLSPEEEELIASLNTRLNAIRTLESRISLIKSYVSSISPSGESQTSATKPDPTILRDINSLLSNLSLLTPHEQSAFAAETLAQNNDVSLVALLGQLSQSINGMREIGKRTAIVNNVRRNRKQMGGQGPRYEDDILSRDGVTLG